MDTPGPSNRGKKRQEMLIDPAELPNYIVNCIKCKKSQQQIIDYLKKTYNVPPALTIEAMNTVTMQIINKYRDYIDDHLDMLQMLLEQNIALWAKTDPNPLVPRYVEFCILCMMTKKQTIGFLATNCNVDEALTRAEWKKLKRKKRKLFREYYEKMEIMKQREKYDEDASSCYTNRAASDDHESASCPYNDDEAPSNIKCCRVEEMRECCGNIMIDKLKW